MGDGQGIEMQGKPIYSGIPGRPRDRRQLATWLLAQNWLAAFTDDGLFVYIFNYIIKFRAPLEDWWVCLHFSQLIQHHDEKFLIMALMLWLMVHTHFIFLAYVGIFNLILVNLAPNHNSHCKTFYTATWSSYSIVVSCKVCGNIILNPMH